MNDFFKRLGWRLTGGIVTIGLGAFAAAQAQRQGIVDEQPLPALESPAWANSLPIPIQAGPEQRSRDASGSDSSGPTGFGAGVDIMPAAFAAEMSSAGPSRSWVTPPEQDQGQDSSNDLIAQVNHEQPGMAMPMPQDRSESASEVAADAAPGMFVPSMEMPSADQPSMSATAMPAMSMPAMSIPNDDMPQAALDTPSMSMPVMSEIQFDQGPDAGLQSAAPRAIEPAVAQPDMAMPPSASMGPQGFVGDYGSPPNGSGEPSLNNELRYQDDRAYNDPAYNEAAYNDQPQFNNALRAEGPAGLEPMQDDYGQPQSGYNVAAQREMPLPSLPVPNVPSYPSQPEQDLRYADEPNYPRNSNPPARLAGHQSGGNAGDNRRGNQNSYLQDPTYGSDGRDAIAISMPGDRHLEGVQTPSVVIHKRAPAEVKVGRAATFVIQVRNVGSAEAIGVQVHDRIPAGMELVDATPAPVIQGDSLIWDLGSMPVGDERAITMQLIPREEGELGSVARVTFEAAASVRTRSTRPELRIVQRAPQKVLIGQQLEIELEISNVGTGEATGVILQEDVPQGLDHPRGRQLDNALGSLRPGETRREILRLRAVEPGMIRNVVHLIAEDAAEATHSVDVEIVSPSLSVQLAGPGRRYLERQATYMINIGNNGTAPASNVEVIAYLDRGFTFVSTENNGHYDSNRHAVLWSIVNLPPGDSGSVPLTLLPVEEGEQAIRLEAVADLDTRAQSESTVSVQSQAELTFSIADTADPIELGSETTYEIRVKNSGSRNDTNVQVRMVVPQGIQLLESDAAVETDGRGGILFAPHKNLAAGGDLVYRIRVKGVQPDTHIVKAIVTSDQARVPVTKEESTMVYQDR